MEALPTQDEINLYRLFSTPSAVGEFIYDQKYYPTFLDSTDYKPFRFWYKQLHLINSDSRRIGVTGAKNVGKALALDTPIATPTGWTTMGEIRVGDKVFDEQGKPTTVTFATPVMLDHKCFEVVFSDGSIITADADHQWLVWSHAARVAAARGQKRGHNPQRLPEILTTEQLSQNVKRSNGFNNYSVQVTKPLVCPEAKLPIAPYVLGAWLGDGTSRCGEITTVDSEVLAQIKQAGYVVAAKKLNGSKTPQFRIGGHEKHLRDRKSGRYLPVDGSLHTQLRRLSLIRNKHIPNIYIRASESQRRELLAGLMDTDGYIDLVGRCEFTSTNKRLAHDVFELLVGLGFKPTMYVGRAKLYGKDCGTKYRVHFTSNENVFKLSRKSVRQRLDKNGKQRNEMRYIKEIRSVPSVPVRCIQVDSPNHLYLAGKTLIPTHNTIMGVAKLIHKCLSIRGTPTEYKTVLVASAHANTMRPLFQDIVDIWKNHWLLGHFLQQDSNSGINKNDRTIRLKNPYYIEINGRIPGGDSEDEGTGFQMIHPPGDSWAWADEGQKISGGQLDNWMRVVAPETEQYVSGIPKVTLLGSMLHKVQTEPAYRFEFFPLGIVDNPDYTQEQIEQMIEEYGGRQSTRARLVLFGEWVEGLGNFWLDLKLCKPYDETKKTFYPFYVVRSLESSRYNIELLGSSLKLPPPPKDVQDIVAGIDYGASVHPTVISIFFNKNKVWYPWGRIQLEKFKPDQQAEVLDWLDDRFNFSTLGIDAFQGGGGVFNFLQKKELYPHKNYEDRLVYVQATQGIPTEVRTETDAEYQARVGLTRNVKPNDVARQQVAEKQRVIPYSMNKIRDMLYGGELFLPEESELKEEFAGFTEELKTQSQGRSFVEYAAAEKDQDHVVQSWQMFVATLALRKPPKFEKDEFELFCDWYGVEEPGRRPTLSPKEMRMAS